MLRVTIEMDAVVFMQLTRAAKNRDLVNYNQLTMVIPVTVDNDKEVRVVKVEEMNS